MGIFTTVSTALLSHLTTYARAERIIVASAQALALAEAGIDKAVYELNENPSYTGESNTALGTGNFTISVATVDTNTKRITATGTKLGVSETVKATVTIGNTNVAFHYGVQTGEGGFVMDGGSSINGSVYSNGDISATTGVTITGAAIAANPAATTTDQANDSPTPIGTCTPTTCVTFANANGTQDFAQSFQISESKEMNSIEFYIRKVSTPGDATVRIVTDSSGSPGTDTLMTGTLSAAAVTTSFGWVRVTLPSTPVLNPGTIYWVVIDGSSNTNRYYVIGANTSYANGAAKTGQYGSSWTTTGLDGYFRIYLGGGTSLIGGNNYATGVYIGTNSSDDAWAHTVRGATVSGTLYCQTSSFTNKACNTSRPDPTPASMPLSDSNIAEWKADAEAGTVTTGDVTVGWQGASMGPRKIIGNLTVNGGGTLTLTGTLYVTGNVTVSGGGIVRLHSSFGTNDGVIVSDGRVTVNGGGTFHGSGTAGSYPFLVTTSACPAASGCAGANAVDLSGGAGTVAVVAQSGTARINGGSSLKAVTARQIVMTGGAELTYDSGLVNSNFSSGPGGSWEFVPGSYSIAP